MHFAFHHSHWWYSSQLQNYYLQSVEPCNPWFVLWGFPKHCYHHYSVYIYHDLYLYCNIKKLAHEKKIIWNTCMTLLAGSSIWRCCPNEAVYNLCFCSHDCNKNDLGWCMALVGGGLLCAMFICDICSSKVYMFFSNVPGTPRYWYWCTILYLNVNHIQNQVPGKVPRIIQQE